MSFDDKLIFDWGKVLSEVQGFSKVLVKAEKASDAASLTAALKSADKMMSFTLWVKQCTTLYGDWLTLSRAAHSLLKGGSEAEVASTLQGVKAFIQKALDAVAPESFTYHGFKITNKQHLEEVVCRRALEGVDLLMATFKNRGVEKLLTKGLDCINLAVVGGAPGSVAFYGSINGADVPEITLFAGPNSKGDINSNGLSNFIHEFGHHVYYTYLSSEARRAWDAPWETIKPENLEIPTEYGRTNKFEDFAETFVVFMTKPEMLTPTAKYRMQQVLSLSGFYGKPIMRLASDTRDFTMYHYDRLGKLPKLQVEPFEQTVFGRSKMSYNYDRRASRPGPHWNPWPEAPASLKKDLDTLHDLAQSKAVDDEARWKFGLIWNMIVNFAMKDEQKAPQALERAKKTYKTLSHTEAYMVPRTVINLIHGL